MIDHFAILGQPRRPWLEADALKDAFHRRSAALHPDVPGTGNAAQFAALNAAYAALREPASRVRHLLELIDPAALNTAAAPPIELSDLFMQLAGLRRRLDDLLVKRNPASSALARALLAGDESAQRREFDTMRGRLETAEAAALAEVRAIDSRWSDRTAEDARSLASLYHRLSYLARWLAQTREALFALSA
ncbi:MAG TPA: hypothetical protein VEO95_02395 [Chthoniobacteraceae bacterium]|nr:hypothetical protein [Chthoniobacteraceae bacterium]